MADLKIRNTRNLHYAGVVNPEDYDLENATIKPEIPTDLTDLWRQVAEIEIKLQIIDEEKSALKKQKEDLLNTIREEQAGQLRIKFERGKE